MHCAIIFVTLALVVAQAGGKQTVNETNYVERSEIIEVSGVRIPAAVTEPRGRTPKAGIVLVPGSLFSDVDGNYPVWNFRPHIYADLARQLAEAGYAVVRFAKIGPGTGSVVVDPERAKAHGSFAMRVVVARAALELLRREEGGRVTRWFVAGHSEGAVVASLLAADDPSVDGLVLLAGPSVGIFSIMREQLPPEATRGGTDYRDFDDAIARVRRGEPLPASAAANPQTAGMSRVDPAGFRYLVEVDGVDPREVVARVRQPVLVVQGDADTSVRPHHADALVAARGTLPTTLVRLAGLQHFYKVAPEGLDPVKTFMLETETSPEVARAIDQWAAGR
jgi:alpha-beta hydrolase superfamily lysophospholipase